jgi:hypothetical protein
MRLWGIPLPPDAINHASAAHQEGGPEKFFHPKIALTVLLPINFPLSREDIER